MNIIDTKITLPIRCCSKCNKKMRVIKNDFLQRKYCKKCHFENDKEWQLKQFIDGLKDMNLST